MDTYDVLILLTKVVMIILVVVLVITFLKYPKEIIIGILRSPFLTILGDDGDESRDDKYKTHKKLRINFTEYEKYICVKSTNKDLLTKTINEFVSLQPEYLRIVFAQRSTSDKVYLKIDNLNFYDYHFLIQFL